MDARVALAHARSGATLRFSDGRELSGADAVLYWERTLNALEAGLTPLSEPRAADSSAGITPLAASDDGYVYGKTVLHGNSEVTWVAAWTNGMQADRVVVEGYLDVYLESTRAPTTKTLSAGYGESAYGDEVNASVGIWWDSNWQPFSSVANSDHFAVYGPFTAWTNTSANL